jgi:hypothetical protein
MWRNPEYFTPNPSLQEQRRKISSEPRAKPTVNLPDLEFPDRKRRTERWKLDSGKGGDVRT